jgi:hypothetical protein
MVVPQSIAADEGVGIGSQAVAPGQSGQQFRVSAADDDVIGFLYSLQPHHDILHAAAPLLLARPGVGSKRKRLKSWSPASNGLDDAAFRRVTGKAMEEIASRMEKATRQSDSRTAG